MVLAAGFGSRLAPFTLDCPKPLIPVQGAPLVAHLLKQLRDWGVKDVLVNLHHRADLLLRELPALCPPDLRLSLSHEPEILGTGGALRRMAWFVDEEPLWICNADVRQTLDPLPLLREMSDHRPLACLWMLPDCGPCTVRVEEGRVLDFRGGGMTFSGLHLVSPDLWRYVPREEAFSSVITAYEAALRDGREIRGVTVPGSQWRDAGTPERLLDANGGSLCFPGARVDPGVRLERALVGSGARLRAGRTVSGAVFSPERGLTPAERALFPQAEAVEELPARGSDRSFARVHLPDRTVIRVRSGTARPENRHTAAHFRFLARHGVRVPEVLHASPDGCGLWLEDAGRVHLLDRLGQGNDHRNREDMEQALRVAARLHGLSVPPDMVLEPPFGPDLYHWEHQGFVTEFLARHDPEADVAALRGTLRDTARVLEDAPRRLIHRDLQSTNYLWHGGEPVLIDVQGMRLGPVAYDLASLLADPYVDRDPGEQLWLLDAYNARADAPVSRELYARGAVQRLAQALGAYGRLGADPATRRFRRHIPAAVRQLTLWAPAGPLKNWAEAFFMRHCGKFPVW